MINHQNTPNLMRAIIYKDYGGPEVLKISDVQKPILMKNSNNVLIKVSHAGVNRPELMQRQGLYPPPKNATNILGLEVSGKIAEVGEKVENWKVGDKVCALCNGGGYAEYVSVDERHCMPIPNNFSLFEAAGIPETFLTVWCNVFYRGKLRGGETLLVHGGASGIGTTAIQLAINSGVKVFTTAGNDKKCNYLKKLGVEECFNYRNEDFSEKILNSTKGLGVNMILDMVGGSYFQKNLASLSIEGRLIIIATMGGAKAEIDLSKLMMKRQTIFGTTLRPQSDEMKGKYVSNFIEKGWKWLDSNSVKPIIQGRYALENASDAHKALEEGNHIGKYILDVTQ